MLAVVWAIKHFRVYLEGRKFILQTDHSALRWILSLKDPTNRLARWLACIQQYDFEVVHVKGKNNVVPDALSRRHYSRTKTSADAIIDQFPDLNMQSSEVHENKEGSFGQTCSASQQTSSSDMADACVTKQKSDSIRSINKKKNVTFNDILTTIENSDHAANAINATSLQNTDFIGFPKDHDHLASVQTRSMKRQSQMTATLEPIAQQVLDTQSFTRDEIKRQQRMDPQISPILDYLLYGKLPQDKQEMRSVLLRQEDYIIIEGILFHLFTSHGPQRSRASAQLVVPRNLRLSLLKQHHDNALGGHLGSSRMLSIMRPRFFWIGMNKDVLRYVHTCQLCNTAKSSNLTLNPPLTLRDPAPGPFHTLFMDTVGPLPRTQNGHKHLVCVTDQYSRYIIVWPTADITAKSIAKKFYEKVICIHGCPKRLLSDNGSAFVSDLFQELCSLYGVTQTFSTAYSPQSQGQVERSQRSIISLLRTFVSSKQTDWDKFLPPLSWALNTSDNTPLGCSAFMLVFGRLPVFPSEADLPDVFGNFSSAHAVLADIVDRQQTADEFATAHLKAEQEKMKTRYDSRATDKHVKVGDTVFVYQPRVRVLKTKRKLQRNYHGPYIVAKFTTDTTVILKRLSDGKFLKKSIHVRRLKKGHIRAKTNRWDPLPIKDSDADEDENLTEDDLPDNSFDSPLPDLNLHDDDNDVDENDNDSDDENNDNERENANIPSDDDTDHVSEQIGDEVDDEKDDEIVNDDIDKDILNDSNSVADANDEHDTCTTDDLYAMNDKNEWCKVTLKDKKPLRGANGEFKYLVKFENNSYRWLTKERVNDALRKSPCQ